MRSNIVHILLLLQVALYVRSSTYVFRRTNILMRTESWENGDIPCENDRIRFDRNKIATVLIAGSLQSQTIDLPNDGVLFFNETMDLGKLGKWQCKRRQEAKEVHFKPSPALAYHNGSNWMVVTENGEERRPALHVLQVPSSEDIAVIPADSGTRILLEDFVDVATLMSAGRAISGDRFDDTLLWSIEGQFQFELSPKLKYGAFIHGIEYQWPKFTNTVTVLGQSKRVDNAGQFSSNMNPEKFSLICSYQQCRSTEQLCGKPFRPIGHCCEICGSMLRFRSSAFDFEKFREQAEKYKRQNRMMSEYGLDIAVLRIDRGDLVPRYQIVVIGNEQALSSSSQRYEARIYYRILMELGEMVRRNFDFSNTMSVMEEEELVSTDLYKFDFGDIVLIFLLIPAVAAVTVGVILVIKRDFDPIKLESLPRINNAFHEMVVRWRGTKAEDELELLHNDGTSSGAITSVDYDAVDSTQQHSEFSSTFENIAFSENVFDGTEEK